MSVPTTVEIPTDRLLTTADVRRILNIAPRTLWDWVASGRLPQPIRLAPRKVMFDPGAIRAVVEGRSHVQPDGPR